MPLQIHTADPELSSLIFGLRGFSPVGRDRLQAVRQRIEIVDRIAER